MITDFKIALIVLVLVCCLLGYLAHRSMVAAEECIEAGGVLVRAASGYVCVEAKEIK